MTTLCGYGRPSHEAGREYVLGGPSVLPEVVLDETLAGVGAVGCICAEALWAANGVGGDVLLVDGDPRGIDVTNLNRYLLFTGQHIGQPKASSARDLLSASGIRWSVHDGPLETAPGLHRRILCAVDINEARLAAQTRWPESLLMASTNELRAEVVRCDPRHGGPCARCHNDPETVTPDEELRRQFREASPDQQRAIAARDNAALDEVIAWAETGECGTSGERVRDAMRAGRAAHLPLLSRSYRWPRATCWPPRWSKSSSTPRCRCHRSDSTRACSSGRRLRPGCLAIRPGLALPAVPARHRRRGGQDGSRRSAVS